MLDYDKAFVGPAYGAYEKFIVDVADELGVDPRELQGVAWSGYRSEKHPELFRPKPMIEELNEAIERTSQVLGITPQEVLRGFMHAKIPLYGLGGAAVALPMMTDSQGDGQL